MLKILFIIFIIIPLSIYIGTLIANVASLILMAIAVGVGGLGHRVIKGKNELRWDPPEYLQVAQFLIIYGFILSVYANVFGGVLNWDWLIRIGTGLSALFGALLVVDLIVLMILATVHGPFDFLGE